MLESFKIKDGPGHIEMMITNIEFNVLRVMTEKDIDWTWMLLDRTLATRGIPGFSNVVNIVTNLMNNGLVDAVYNDNPSRPRYRVSEQGHQLLTQMNEFTKPNDVS